MMVSMKFACGSALVRSTLARAGLDVADTREGPSMSFLIDFFKALAGICETNPLSEDHWELQENKVVVRVSDVPELQRQGGAVYLQGGGLGTPILVVRGGDDSYHCFENRCTHMGRRLDPVQGKAESRCCSVSHSTFDYQGAKLSGPAKGPIRPFASHVEGGELVIII
jgi:nitrite reductase/ring-hydroxylating ferredoxin subunit